MKLRQVLPEELPSLSWQQEAESTEVSAVLGSPAKRLSAESPRAKGQRNQLVSLSLEVQVASPNPQQDAWEASRDVLPDQPSDQPQQAWFYLRRCQPSEVSAGRADRWAA